MLRCYFGSLKCYEIMVSKLVFYSTKPLKRPCGGMSSVGHQVSDVPLHTSSQQLDFEKYVLCNLVESNFAGDLHKALKKEQIFFL